MRIPLLKERHLKPVFEGNYAYLSGLDLNRLNTIDWYVKPAVGDTRTGWLKYMGQELRNSRPALDSEAVTNILSEQLDFVTNADPRFYDAASLKQLVSKIYDLEAVLVSAGNQDLSAMREALQQYSYQILSVLYPILQSIEDIELKEQHYAGLDAALENMDTSNDQFLMSLGILVETYHKEISSTLAAERTLKGHIASLQSEFDRMEEQRRNLRVAEESISEEDIVLCALDIASEEVRNQVTTQVNELDNALSVYEAKRLELVSSARQLRQEANNFGRLISEAKKAYYALTPHFQHDHLSKLKKDWIKESIYDEVVAWLEAGAHERPYWDARLKNEYEQLAQIEYRLGSPYMVPKLDSWKESVQIAAPVVAPARVAMKAARTSVPSPAPAPLPRLARSAAETPQAAEPVLDEAVVVPENFDCLKPKTLTDLLELFKLFVAAKTDNNNRNFSVTFKSALGVLELAGFDLSNINIKTFRDFARKHDSIRLVEDLEAVNATRLDKRTTAHLLTYRVGRGSPVSRERFKVTRNFASSEMVAALENKWQITRAMLSDLHLQRKELLKEQRANKKPVVS